MTNCEQIQLQIVFILAECCYNGNLDSLADLLGSNGESYACASHSNIADVYTVENYNIDSLTWNNIRFTMSNDGKSVNISILD